MLCIFAAPMNIYLPKKIPINPNINVRKFDDVIVEFKIVKSHI